MPWRESIADVEAIPLNERGQICSAALKSKLLEYRDRPLKIGSFSAASNVTGIKTDIEAVSTLLKEHGALAFWDYAAAAPYVGIDMNGQAPLDAVFISPHKFIGGPGSPGILVVKKAILTNSVPAVVGGGTVLYVTPEDHRYLEDHERREEGGTPAIVESIRAGLAFKLQREVGTGEIEHREAEFVRRAVAYFTDCPNLEILGNTDVPRLSILSLRFKHGDRDLHYGFVVSLLNDLFGIQVRGGCSCAGPYGHSLLGIDMDYSRAIEKEISEGAVVLRPGWVRLNFNYFIDEVEFEYLLRAVTLVADHGWRLLPYYHYDDGAGVWRYADRAGPELQSMSSLSFADYCRQEAARPYRRLPLEGQIERAQEILLNADPSRGGSRLELVEKVEELRWFVLPQEVAAA